MPRDTITTQSESLNLRFQRARPGGAGFGDRLAMQAIEANLFGHGHGARMGRFRLERTLGSGGMGTVWRAYDDQLDRAVALKFLKEDRASPRGERRLFEEAQALAQLSHPNVVSVFDVGRHDGRVWIAMEHVPGQTLSAWGKKAPRKARLRAWLDAGRGLAAVHQAGLIHRDVKPDNVLIGDDGRVRLIDFGLVRAVGGRSQTEPSDGGAQTAAPRNELESLLTPAGSFVGTPAYAAPEQRRGASVDARSDQYAFCVSVWEALTDERPSSSPAKDPAARRLGRRIRRALLRGLEQERSERFPSMEALLEALEPRRTLRWALLGALPSVALAASFAAASDSDPCALPDDGFVSSWQDHGAPFLATALADAEPSWSAAARSELDTWVEHWGDASRQACEDSRVHGRFSEEVLDLRTDCLDRLTQSFTATNDALRSNPELDAGSVAALLDALPPVEQCSNTGVLRHGPRPPRDPQRVAAIREELARITSRMEGGLTTGLRPQLDALLTRAEAIDYRPLEAETLALIGKLALAEGDVDRGEARILRAISAAEASRHDRVSADNWILLARSRARFGVSADDRSRALERALAAVERLDDARDPAWIRLGLARATLLEQRENWRGVIAEMDAAEALASELLEAGHKDRIEIHRRRANAYGLAGEPAKARADFQEALERFSRRWGETNLYYARLLQDRGAFFIEVLGDLEAGREDLRRARALYRRFETRGADPAWLEVTLGLAAYLEGDYATAATATEAGHRLLAEALGDGHSDTLMVLGNLGSIRFRQGDFAGARAAYASALEEQRTQLGLDHPEVGRLEGYMGETLLAAGELDDARSRLTKAQHILESQLGPEHADLGPVLKGLGLVALETGDAAQAAALFERAELNLNRNGTPDPAEAAEISWGLARAYAALERRQAATTAAARSVSAYRDLGEAAKADEIESWAASLP